MKYDEAWLKELKEKGMRPAGTGYAVGTIITMENGDQYIVGMSGAFHRAKMVNVEQGGVFVKKVLPAKKFSKAQKKLARRIRRAQRSL